LSDHSEIYKELNDVKLQLAEINQHLIVAVIGAVALALSTFANNLLGWFSSLPKG
jgi:hypothetical protein